MKGEQTVVAGGGWLRRLYQTIDFYFSWWRNTVTVNKLRESGERLQSEDWTLPLCPVTLVISLGIKSSFSLMVMNSTWQKNPRRPSHTFIYSAGINWTNISRKKMIHNLVLLCFNSAAVIHHPHCGLLVCMQLSGPAFILLRLCHWEPQELIFSAGFVVKPLAAVVLRVSFPFHWSRTDKEPWAGRSRLLCISEPPAASEGFCYLAAWGAADTQHSISLCTN